MGEKKPQKRKQRDGTAKPSKKSRKELPAAAAAAAAAVAPPPPASLLLADGDDTDPDFPRGGTSLLSRAEEAEARAEAEAEFEREEGKDRRSKNKKRRMPFAGPEDDVGSLFGEGITGKLPRFVNRITLKNISSRMKLWGVIVEVNSKDLVINLPGGLRGYVRAEEVSDVINSNKDAESNSPCSIFHVGQLVSCIVLQVDDDKREGKGNRRIWLSLRLSLVHKGLTLDSIQDGMVLTAQVKSVEDHGYILHFGGDSFTGFLPRNKLGDGELSVGIMFQGLVRRIDKARAVVYLVSDPDIVSKCVTKDLKGLSIDQLVPGMMVNARVHAILENGIMLTFLTYFTGTVDIFHLQNSFPTANWKDDYAQNKKINARILFVDPSTRAVGLTLSAHLLHNKAPPTYVKTGDIYDCSRIVRVDKGTGLLLEIPSNPAPSPAFVSIFDVSDEENLKVEKMFKEGSHVRVRVLGYRHLEGLAMGTLKASAFEGSVFTHSDVKPGMLVKAKVIAVESFGAIVQLATGVKALCPLPHMSEFEIAKPSKKFKVGADLLFRVLGCKSKRITVTHKKTLVKSKLNVLASYADAIEGLVVHGWITKIEKHGCFVRFYNGMQGFAHRTELGLGPGSEANEMYHVGQVVKCRVLTSVPATRKISLSFVLSPKRNSQDCDVKVGCLVAATVERLTPAAVIVHVNKYTYLKGSIANEHLADHQGQAALLKSLLKPGYEFDELLVLDAEGNNLVLSAKYSLINSFQDIPSHVSQIRPSSVVHGYICNIIGTGCFVRFLGRLAGFSPKNKAIDEKIDDLSHMFYIGQSIRSHVLSVDNETGHTKLSLKQSYCFSTDISFIQGYFLLEDKIAALQISDSGSSIMNWGNSFRIGSVIEGEIQEIKEYGVVLNFKDHGDTVGFITHHQLGGCKVESGSVVKAFVLDIVKTDNLVDLSLKTELVNRASERTVNSLRSRKKRARAESMHLELHQTVNAVVEIVKDNYLVLSIPNYDYAIGYAFIADYNTQKLPTKHFVHGQCVAVSVGALPSPESSGRLLLLLRSLSEVSETSSSKRAKKKSGYNVGSLVEGEIIDIKPLELVMKFGIGLRGRVHITEVSENDHFVENPFSSFRIGQLLTARVVGKAHQAAKAGRSYQWELSVKPSFLTGANGMSDTPVAEDYGFAVGDVVKGYVVRVDAEWIWLTISRYVTAHIFILDSSSEPSELEEFQKHYYVGKVMEGRILSFNKEKKLLRLSALLSSSVREAQLNHESLVVSQNSEVSNINVSEHIVEGDVVCGKVKKILPGVGGLLVQIGPHLHGKVHYTELVDIWAPDPLSSYQEGQFVKCKVLEISRSPEGFLHVDLSLRASLQGNQSITPAAANHNMDFFGKRFQRIDDVHPDMDVQGYVKNVNAKGCFIMLSRSIDARILLSNLSDRYIENPEKEFAVGKLVHGKVLSVDPSFKRVDVTLKADVGNQMSKSDSSDFSNLHVGDRVSGIVRRVESYGLFIKIENTSMVGLCHISQLSDEPTDNIDSIHKAGDKVVTKILKIDKERRRISLGMKNSHVGDASGSYHNRNDEDLDGNPVMDDALLSVLQKDKLLCTGNIYKQEENDVSVILSQADSRASILPLEVSLDDLETSEPDNDATVYSDIADNAVVEDRRMKKKAKEERELKISASEERSLQNDMPQTADDFEKLVRISPNSSFVWIKYMAFMLSVADVEKARSIAERALQTINIREEGEKLNIWVAYFNLENEYGNPPEEAVRKTFQRALQYCDPKKLHLALLGMYERTEQQKLAEEILERISRKFKGSCKVWIRRVQYLLKVKRDGVQSIVNRALLSLPRRKHIKFLSQAAILEFKCGVPDRGRSMFEGILREYPKRTDLWSIYLDQEIRLGDKEIIRALFERATCLSLPPKRMKFLLKKYLDYEKSHGDKDRIDHVMEKAMEYAESSLG